jgi:hypothetical protein
MASGRAPTPGERFGGGAIAILQSGLFSVAGIMLPWSFDPGFSSACIGFAALSAAAGGLLLAGHPRALGVWRIQAFVGLVVLAGFVALFLNAGAYLAGLYGPLGLGLGIAIQLLLTPGLLFILPASVWAIAATGGLKSFGSSAGVTLLTVAVIGSAVVWVQSEAKDPPSLDERAWAAELGAATSTASAVLPIHRGGAFDCARARGRMRALIAYRTRFGETRRCIGAADLEALRAAVAAGLREDEATRPVKLDVLWTRDDISRSPRLATAFRLRAGRDGACAGTRCLAPWQLMAAEAYTAYQPVPVIPDLKIGVDPRALRRALGLAAADAEPWSGLRRARTLSYVLDASGALVALDRLRPTSPRIDDTEAVQRAERFLIANQRGDGRFNYLVDPFTGPVRSNAFSIARQAGTTFALCEWGSDAVRPIAARALRHLKGFMRHTQAGTGLAFRSADRARLGPASLTLAAFGMCRKRFGFREFDPWMARMGKFVLSLQDRETGRFAPYWEFAGSRPVPGPHDLYADGQAVLALTLLLEPAGQDGPIGAALDRDEVETALQLAKDYITGPYWGWPLRSFFFLEENWHCLAAKAALRVDRDDRYERFCLALARWRTRLVQTEPAGDRGAYHFGHVSAPYTTPTAGYLEAGSAALEIAKARGEPAPRLEAGLRRAMDFMVRAQWDETSCFACTTRLPMVGAYSEGLATTTVRVDYVQHAMAGLAGARRALEL